MLIFYLKSIIIFITLDPQSTDLEKNLPDYPLSLLLQLQICPITRTKKKQDNFLKSQVPWWIVNSITSNLPFDENLAKIPLKARFHLPTKLLFINLVGLPIKSLSIPLSLNYQLLPPSPKIFQARPNHAWNDKTRRIKKIVLQKLFSPSSAP